MSSEQSSNDGKPGNDAVRTTWSTQKPTTMDHDDVVSVLYASKPVVEAIIFERRKHAPITYMG